MAISNDFLRSRARALRAGFVIHFLVFGCLVALFTTMQPLQASDRETRRLRVVFELSSGDPSSFDGFLAKVEGLQKNSGTLADITVVASSRGVGLFRLNDNPLKQRLAKLADHGIDFVACEGSLTASGMSPADYFGFVRTVRSGGDEVERLEEQGWARVRDGESYVSHL